MCIIKLILSAKPFATSPVKLPSSQPPHVSVMLRLRPWTRIPRALSDLPQAPSKPPLRTFSYTPSLPAKPLPARLKIDDADVTISYLKGTGPGGQKIVCCSRGRPSPRITIEANYHQNKTNSAVQIIHKPSGVVVKCQATRSRSQNEKIARQLLADKVEAREKGDQSRVALKAEAARKKKASKVKKAKRKYRALEKSEEDVGGEDAVEHEHEVDGEDGVAESAGKGSSV